MKRNLLIAVSFLLLFVCSSNAHTRDKEVRPVKNVILMIPDGTSIGVVSAARWYKIYNKLGDKLSIDPYLCGTVQTFCSNAPIGDSAPTTSCYMTGIPQQAGNVSIYPLADPKNDLFPLDPQMAYQPLATILEAAKIEQNKATGLVVTVTFTHATPADCSAHYYDRNKDKYLAPQIAYNNLDVVFGAGNHLITNDIEQHFKNTNTTLIRNDLKALREFNGDNRVWALFEDKAFPYDIDRDSLKIPSLEEMTRKAINQLSKNKNGFFLMIEGSQVDWAAHGNDAIGCITEYLAFDKAVQVAIDFAKENGETAIVILPDHGNSGFTIGRRDLKNYTRASIEKLFGNVSKFKRTSYGLEGILLKNKPENFKAIIKEYTDIDITDDELEYLLKSKNYKHEDYTKTSESYNLVSALAKIMNDRTYFGFTTGGHTGEEVFLAAYHPQGDVPMGMYVNYEINDYLYKALGLKTALPDLTQKIFARHTNVFAGLDCKIETENEMPVLIVKKGHDILKVPAFKSVAYFNDKPFDLGSVTVYIDKNNTFYLPENLRSYF